MLGLRDIEYVENRLLAPAPALWDAIERLAERGEHEAAGALTGALQRLTDECRAVRIELRDARRRQLEIARRLGDGT